MKMRAVLGVIMLVAASVVGCQSGESLTAAGKVVVEPLPSREVRVAWADVWQDGDDVVVRGCLVRREVSAHPLTGHVDVTFLDTDGNVLKKVSSRDVGVRRSTPGKGGKLSPFEVRVKFTPPTETKAVVAYHAGSH